MYSVILIAAAQSADALETVIESVPDLLLAYLRSNFITFAGVLFALMVAGRLLIEKRAPSNIFAWCLLILFLPLIGVPLYFIFGGRKSRRLVRRKLEIQRMAYQLITGKKPPVQVADQPVELPRVEHTQNAFQLLPNGLATYKALMRLIRDAKKRIHIETFILGNDKVAQKVLCKLAQRAKEGVEVRLLIDAAGSSRAAWKLTKELRQSGGHAVRFMPSMLSLRSQISANLRNHRKIAVFDERIAVIGGQNIEVRGIGPTHNARMNIDFSAVIEGPVVGTLTRTFISDWCFAAKENPEKYKSLISYVPPAAGHITMEAIASGPDMAGDVLWERILLLINAARSECTLVTPYFVPDEVTFRNIELKARSGHRVRLIVPEHSNHAMVDLARNSYLHTLEKAGCEILMYRGKEMLHAKLFIADHKVALMGSVNLDMRSLFVNFEIGLLLSSPEPVLDLERWVETALLPKCIPYSQSQQSRSSKNRRLLEDAAHLIAPLL